MSTTSPEQNIQEMSLEDVNEAIDMIKNSEENERELHRIGMGTIVWIADKLGYGVHKSVHADCYVMLPIK